MKQSTLLRQGIRLVVSAGTSLLVLAMMFRLFTHGIDDEARPHLLVVLSHTAWIFLLPYAILTLTQGVFRAIRYRLLIRADGSSETPSFWHTLQVTLVRNMMVDLLPARTGELSYVTMMNRGCRVAADACLSSLGVSFVFDIVALGIIVGGVLLWQLVASDVEGWVLTAGVALAVLSLLLVGFLFLGIRWAAMIVGKLPLGRLGGKLAEFADRVADSVATARREGVLWRTLVLSILVRLGKYGGLYFLFKAVTVPSFTSLSGAAPSAVIGSFLAAEGAASLPVPAFMSFGSYEAGGTLALTLLQFTKAESMVAMLAIHVWSQILDYSLGGLAAILFVFRRRPVEEAGEETGGLLTGKHRLRLAGISLAAILLAAGAVALLWQIRRVRKMGGLRPPSAGHAVAPDVERDQARQQAIRELDGLLVWSSNRGGNHDIYGMELPSGKIRPLTRHPHTEYFPRLSPDGKRMAFCRSQHPWVSQRNYVAWDVYVQDLETGREICVCTNANTPVWTRDGQELVYQKAGNRVVACDLRTGMERDLIVAGRDAGLSERVMFETPSHNDRHRALALTLRKGRRGTVVWTGDKLREVAGGCELVWGGTGRYLLYIDKGGHQKNAVYQVKWPSLERSLFLDLPGHFSHEYFPREDPSGRYLVLGASTGGHEHDKADYEIFLWKIGSPAGQAVRMTFHTGNDCWPDLWLRPSSH